MSGARNGWLLRAVLIAMASLVGLGVWDTHARVGILSERVATLEAHYTDIIYHLERIEQAVKP
jgi:hypothetical protein